jgi:hypothetical protein
VRRIQRASRVHRPAERQVPAGDDALEGGEKKKVRVTLRRAARRGLSAPIHGRLGIPADVPALKFALQVWKAFVIRPFPKIGATRSTHLRWQVQPPLYQCTP